MRILTSWLCVAVLTTNVFAAAAANKNEAVEDFSRRPAIEDVRISPSGKRLAVLMFGPEGHRRVGVMDLDPLGQPRVVGAFTNADVTNVRWVNDDRLVFEAFQPGPLINVGGAATIAVNHDGSRERKLISWEESSEDSIGTMIHSRILPYGWSLRSTIDDGSDDVLVEKSVKDNLGDLKQIFLARLNTVTGELRPLSYGMPNGTRSFLVDGNGEPRVLTAHVDGRDKIYWRKPGADTWDQVADFDPLGKGGFRPRLVDEHGDVLVEATSEGGTAGFYHFDPAAKRLDPEPVLRLAGFDLDSAVLELDPQTRRLVGLHFRTERPVSVWLDAGLQRIQRGVDAALPPGRSNRLYCGRCETTRFFVIRSTSDRQPGQFFLFDRSKSSLVKIGDARPWIDEALQGRRTFHRVTARDGLRLPVYVTHPHGASDNEALPAVVLVHGGPWVRGSDLTWEDEAQFLASRGYRVLQPEFRGSLGYGFDHFRAGWKQWGRAMQDDLADTVAWAATQHLIDPKRVCIVGASYGGYAALMGPIAHPGVYRCAASFAGVTDISLMFTASWSDIDEDSRQYSMPVLIGDPASEADHLNEVSPLKRVADLKVPVLMVHGGVDRRVPIDHEREFVAAAQRAGVDVEKVVYPEEGHGFFDPANHADYFRNLERFLGKWLQTPR